MYEVNRLVIAYSSSKSNFGRFLTVTDRAFKNPRFAIDVIGRLDAQKLHR